MKKKWTLPLIMTVGLGGALALLPFLSSIGEGGRKATKPPKKIPVAPSATTPPAIGSTYAVLAYNDLGMHCMNPSFAEFCLLPPFNTLHATVIKATDCDQCQLHQRELQRAGQHGIGLKNRFLGLCPSAFWCAAGLEQGADRAGSLRHHDTHHRRRPMGGQGHPDHRPYGRQHAHRADHQPVPCLQG